MRPMVQRLGYVALNGADNDAADRGCVHHREVSALVERERGGRALLTSNQRHAELIQCAS